MRRKEAHEKLRQAMAAGNQLIPPALLLVSEATCDAVLAALGVEVEPDEEPLPTLISCSEPIYIKDRKSSRVTMSSGNFCVAVEYRDNWGARLCDALFLRYNAHKP